MKWIPLESGIDVMLSYAKALEFPTGESDFHDVYGTDPDLLAMVPGPHRAVLLLYPTGEKMDAVVDNTGEVLKSEEVLWIPQTIGNACGTMGLLHALANSGLAPPDRSPFAQFLAAARALPRAERTRLLEQTELFADAHVDASSAGQSLLRDEDAHTNLHFTTFVQATLSDGQPHLIELNGNRAGPIDHGPTSGDLLSDAVKFVKDVYMATDPTNDLFNLMCLGGPADAYD